MLFTYTEASRRALLGLRDMSMIKWYAVPLLLIIVYALTKEIKESRATSNWDPIFTVLVLLGADFFNETWNGWVFHFSERSAVWTAPGDTAYRVTVGWNFEIIMAFTLFGLVYYHSLLDKDRKILGLPNRWFFAVFFAVLAVIIEVILNHGGHLVWEYSWWKFTIGGIWIIFFLGYFYWFVLINIMLDFKTTKSKILYVSAIFAVPVIMNIIAWAAGWRY